MTAKYLLISSFVKQHKIPLHPPFPKGEMLPLFGKEGLGEILKYVFLAMNSLVITALSAILLISGGCSRFGGVESPTGPSEVRPKVFMDLYGSPQKNINNQFTVSVYIENVTNLYYANMYIKYDPAKIKYIGGAKGEFLERNNGSTFFEEDEDEKINPDGIILVGITRSSPKLGESGSGTLCTLTFEAKATTEVTGTSIQFLDEAPYYLGLRGIDESLNEYDVEATIKSGITVYVQ